MDDKHQLLPKEPARLQKIRKVIKQRTKQLYKVLASDIITTKLPLKILKENTLMHYVVAWVLWLTVGMVAYANLNFDGNYAKGFYYAISIGYSIGWGVFHDKATHCKVFSIFYILVGATFVTRWIAYLIERAVKDSSDIYEKKMIRENIKANSTLSGVWLEAYAYLVENYDKLLIIYIWCIYIFFGASWSCAVVKWPIIDGVYYSISSMSTAGAWGVPEDSPDYVFAVTGLFAAFGAPIMGIAVGNIANLMLESRYIEPAYNDHTVLQLNEDEMNFLNAVRDGTNGHSVDRKEYLLLHLFREERISATEVKIICDEFTRMQQEAAASKKSDASVDSNVNVILFPGNSSV